MTRFKPDFTDTENELIRSYYPWLARPALKAKLPGRLWYDIQKQAVALGVVRDAYLSRIHLTERDYQAVIQTFGPRAGVIIEISRRLKRPTKEVRRFIEVLTTQKHLASVTGTLDERRARKFTYLWHLLDDILQVLPPRFERTSIKNQLEEVIGQLKSLGWFRHRAASHTIAYALVCYVCHQAAAPEDPKFPVPLVKQNAVNKTRCLIGQQLDPGWSARTLLLTDPTPITG